jgi:hypothetical protein
VWHLLIFWNNLKVIRSVPLWKQMKWFCH